MKASRFPPSLVHYKPPLLLLKCDHQKTGQVSSKIKTQSLSTKVSSEETKQGRRIQEALDVIFPPRTYEDDGNLWIQNVSTNPATTSTIISLEEQLNLNLLQEQVRETGICKVRRELYDQCFDELIREETIMLPERGLLLSNIKDELKMTLESCKTLYESSVAYGIRKVLQVEKDKVDKEAKMEKIKKMKDDMYEKVKNLKKEYDLAERKMKEEFEIERQMHEKELSDLKTSNQKLKNHLENVMMSMVE